jgi:hypothetical protein
MRNKRVATLLVAALVIVLVAACIVAAGRALMLAVRSMHSIMCRSRSMFLAFDATAQALLQRQFFGCCQ